MKCKMHNAKCTMQNESAPHPLLPSHANYISKMIFIKGGENCCYALAFLPILNSYGVGGRRSLVGGRRSAVSGH